MGIQINNIRLTIDDEIQTLKNIAAKQINISVDAIRSFRIIKESVDARRKGKIDFIYSVFLELNDDEENMVKKINDDNVRFVFTEQEDDMQTGTEKMVGRPVIIGTGPAGLFAGLVLASRGYRPLLLERGQDVDGRSKSVHHFWKTNQLDLDSNVQFGEGGAGTFSDGKLTTRINDRRCNRVLAELVEAGAPEEIRYRGKPHIGTDLLKSVVKNMRNRIISLGGEVRFSAKVTDLKIVNGTVKSIIVNGKEEIPCSTVVLAIGHSARDTYELLLQRGVQILQKPFSIGVRIEHPQKTIDLAQYGDFAGHPRLKAADYQLVYKGKERTCYSFCMCPGGVVVAAASESNSIVTNGMSEFARDRDNANSALVVSVEPKDYGSSHPLAGVEFQRKWERLAFQTGGSNYSAPVQKVADFMENKPSAAIGSIKPSYTGNVIPADLTQCLPRYVTDTMKEGLCFFERKVKGYSAREVIMTGVETRTSSPIKIPRGENGEAANIVGLYPAGEGAGYAGGIVSAAVDGVRIAEFIIEKYSPSV